ncbi:MAG TPA: ABC transporter ATP-binding protein [Bradyrhizobium sp.]|nr:ABC transporter ATP-binding protein [Bradyrhizobium sp.]
MSAEPLLQLCSVSKSFNGLAAVNDVSFAMRRGEVVGLVGPNGSGKTTTINLISGITAVDSGRILLEGQSIERRRPFRRVQLGINRTFQVPKPFRDMTVAENIEVALEFSERDGADAECILTDLGLAAQRNKLARSLTVCQQKMLDLGRALATSPQLLLIDEIGAGLNPSELRDIADLLIRLSRRGTALVVVEHLLNFVNRITDHVIVLNAGVTLFEGTLQAASADSDVIAAFLGG